MGIGEAAAWGVRELLSRGAGSRGHRAPSREQGCDEFRMIVVSAEALTTNINLHFCFDACDSPTDIIAGYGVGYLWLMICITMLKLQRINNLL